MCSGQGMPGYATVHTKIGMSLVKLEIKDRQLINNSAFACLHFWTVKASDKMFRLLDTIIHFADTGSLPDLSSMGNLVNRNSFAIYRQEHCFLLSLKEALTLRALPSPPRAPVSSQPAAGGRGGT